MPAADSSAKLRIVRDKDFAKRLDQAISSHPSAPDGHGRQKWLRERIQNRFNLKLSPEAVRKWFSGEARPRPSMMSHVAAALEVDEAWLSLGLTPNATPDQRRQQNLTATGAVKLIAGMIEMSGGHIAFPTEKTELTDLYAIIDATQYSVVVRNGKARDDGTQLTVPHEHEKSVVLVAMQVAPTSYTILRLPSEVISAHGKRQGGYYDLDIQHNGQSYSVGGVTLAEIHSFNNLDGEIPRRR